MVVKYGLDSSVASVTNFEGIAKYPHITVINASPTIPLSEMQYCKAMLDFGRVSIGKTEEKWIEIRNLAPVTLP